ncbi:e3 ubiquitin-protein ligase [Nesidiocoris tenuis]|uniref:E3 ubiquitin-protein ligase MARCHF5 n=1 Tax=Nesidiocoris tenuis TaxID=355587 RepID=A0ABN7AD19_9HEMI|nr:e3 ubiquitin-protein ligase [Nesidiocoris tenuis]
MDEPEEPRQTEPQNEISANSLRNLASGQPPLNLQEDNLPPRLVTSSTTSTLQCWICYATQEDDPRLSWIKPCKCRGGTKWVHQTCLQSWIDQKLREDRKKSVACPQCKTEYLIHLPAMGILVQLIDAVDNLFDHFSSLIVDCCVLASLYWSALTYGAMTVVYVGGHRSTDVVQSIHPTVVLMGLPLIPLATILVGSIEWEIHLGRILVAVLRPIPFVGRVVRNASDDSAVALVNRRISDRMLSTRKCITSLFLPAIAKLCGDLFYSSTSSVLRRFLAGGVTFIGVKTTITYYHKRQIRKKLTDLKVLDYTDQNRERFAANNQI